MAKRRQFVPADPSGSTLEARLSPSNIFGLGHAWDSFTTGLGFHHHASPGNTAAIKAMWDHSAKLSKPVPASVPAKHAIHFK